jgi:hypothetical protein
MVEFFESLRSRMSALEIRTGPERKSLVLTSTPEESPGGFDNRLDELFPRSRCEYFSKVWPDSASLLANPVALFAAELFVERLAFVLRAGGVKLSGLSQQVTGFPCPDEFPLRLERADPVVDELCSGLVDFLSYQGRHLSASAARDALVEDGTFRGARGDEQGVGDAEGVVPGMSGDQHHLFEALA